jgi:putative DNA primase/helicase
MATFNLQTMARTLGGEVAGRQVLAPGPGHSTRDRSLAVRISNDAPDGFLCHSHAGDDWRVCRDHVRAKLGLPTWQPGDDHHHERTIKPSHIDKWDFGTVDAEAEGRGRTEDDLIRIERAQAIWNESRDPRRTPAEDYLRSRALNLADDVAGAVLRFHPACPWRNENTGRTDRVLCLIAAFRSIDDDTITGIHRIRVDQPTRWPKTDRRMLGLVHRAAIKLAPVGDELLIAEGLETAMSPRQADITTPCWALGSVGAISFFPIIPGIKKLKIAAEPGNASERAIRICRQRWRREGHRVITVRSASGGDLNDAIMARAAGGVK